MEVHCQKCDSKFNLPDEKVPKNQVLKIGCPKCKEKITIDTRQASAPSSGPEAAGKGKEKGYDYSDYSQDDAIGFYEEGAKLALILDSNAERLGKIKESVEALGYRFVASPNTRDAIGKMRFHHFDLILVADGYDGQPLEHSPIINSLNHTAMSVRRKIFLALLSDKMRTMDNMMAFAMSANMTINTKDIGQLTAALKKGIAENERFYKIFMDTLVEVGKA